MNTLLLILIIVGSIVIGLALVSALLIWFVRKALHSDNGRLARVMVGLLVLQFILGMLSNLFTSIPTIQPWRVFHDFGPILLHTINALYLLILSVIFLVHAIKTGRDKIPAIIGCLAIVCAFTSGLIFVNLGANNLFSFTMALSFIIVLPTYMLVAVRAAYAKSQA